MSKPTAYELARTLARLAPMLVGILTLPIADAQVRGGLLRYRADLRGDMTMAANTILTCREGTRGGGVRCEDARQRNPVMRNNQFDMDWIDADDDPATFDSSAAQLVLPEGAVVAWARLYWLCPIGRGAAPPEPAKAREVKLRVPGGEYVTVQADTFDTGLGGTQHGTMNFAAADVTELVSPAGAGTYWIADMQCARGATNVFGGWSLIAAYEVEGAGLRNIAVFDAYRRHDTTPTEFEVSGFFTPPNGPVRSRLAIVVGDGDAGSEDSFWLSSGGRRTALGDALSPPEDISNSTITLLGERAPGRIPDYPGTFGFDADLIDTVNAMPNSATSATISAQTNGEIIFTGVVAFSTDMLAPDLDVLKTAVDLNGELVRSGDEIEYVLAAKNVGAAGAIDTIVTDPIPEHTTYVPESITLDGRKLTDRAGDDEGEFLPETGTIVVRPVKGTMAIGQGATIRFRVRIDRATTTGTVVRNQAAFTYAHAVLGPSAGYAGLSDGEPRRYGEQPTDLWPIDTPPPPQLTFTKVVADTPSGTEEVVTGDEVTWRIELSNLEYAEAATGVVIEDALDADLTLLDVKTDRGVIESYVSPVRINVGELPGGEKATIEVRTRVNRPTLPHVIENQATVVAANADSLKSDVPDTEELDDPAFVVPGGFAGTGCGCDSTTPATGALLVLLALGLVRRRSWTALALVLAATSANAQVAGFTLDFYRPGVLPQDGFAISGTDTMGDQRVAVNLQFDYANDPLVYERLLGDGSSITQSLVSHQLALHAGVAVGIGERLVTFARVPVNLLMTGEDHYFAPAVDGTLPGDPVLGARWRFLGGREDEYGLALQFAATAPLAGLITGGAAYAGERWFTASPALLADVHTGALSLALNVGATFREAATLANLELGHQLDAGLGMNVEVVEDELSVLLELHGSTTFANFLRREESPAELLAGVKWQFVPEWQAGIAIGPGLSYGAGAPDFRGLLTFAYSPIPEPPPPPIPPPPFELPLPQDTDGDGLLDEVDRCPREAEDFDLFQDDDGCPEADNDADGVLDPEDACPLVQGPAENKGCPWPDSDGDGWIDPQDRCPTVPGDPLNQGCPWADADNDGTTDDKDLCPADPGPPENHGCPLPDRDRDSLPDQIDECPDEPGPVENQGCPKRQLVVLRKEKIEIRDTIYFEFDKDVIQRRSYDLLLKVAQVINEHPEIEAVRVEGHTDTVGGRRHNLDLSKRRARAVMKFLIKRGYVDPVRLVSEGYGPDKPIADNRTTPGRAQNRRVEFMILEEPARAP